MPSRIRGTASLNINAVDNASAKLARSAAKMAQSNMALNKAFNSLVISSTAATAAIAAFSATSFSFAKDVNRAARSLGVNTSSIVDYERAARSAGLSLDELTETYRRYIGNVNAASHAQDNMRRNLELLGLRFLAAQELAQGQSVLTKALNATGLSFDRNISEAGGEARQVLADITRIIQASLIKAVENLGQGTTSLGIAVLSLVQALWQFAKVAAVITTISLVAMAVKLGVVAGAWVLLNTKLLAFRFFLVFIISLWGLLLDKFKLLEPIVEGIKIALGKLKDFIVWAFLNPIREVFNVIGTFFSKILPDSVLSFGQKMKDAGEDVLKNSGEIVKGVISDVQTSINTINNFIDNTNRGLEELRKQMELSKKDDDDDTDTTKQLQDRSLFWKQLAGIDQEQLLLRRENFASDAEYQKALNDEGTKFQKKSLAQRLGNIGVFGKKAQKLQQTLAIIEATTNGAVAIVNAYKSGNAVGGLPVGLLWAATTAAAVAAQIATIKKGSGTTSSSAGGSASAATIPAQQPEQPQTINRFNIRLTGGTFSDEQVLHLIERIAEKTPDTGIELAPG